MKKQLKITTPIGSIFLVASERALHQVHWEEQANVPFGENEILIEAKKQLSEYFQGKRSDFDLTMEAQGTEFQKKVWARLSQIPFGETRSYKDIAIELKDKNACRAVGTANGKNPLSIFVPCHRVISSDGSLGGYAGGLEIKTKLLRLEQESSAL